MDGGAWWAAVHGVAKSRTRLSDLAPAAAAREARCKTSECRSLPGRSRASHHSAPPAGPRKSDAGWQPPPCVVIATTVTTCQVLRSAFYRHFFPHPINPSGSIYEIDMIRPVFQIREWKEAGVTIKSINSGARFSLGASPGPALGQLGDFGQGILPL